MPKQRRRASRNTIHHKTRKMIEDRISLGQTDEQIIAMHPRLRLYDVQLVRQSAPDVTPEQAKEAPTKAQLDEVEQEMADDAKAHSEAPDRRVDTSTAMVATLLLEEAQDMLSRSQDAKAKAFIQAALVVLR